MNRTIRNLIVTAALASTLSGLAACGGSLPEVAAPQTASAQPPPPATAVHPTRPVGRPTHLTIPAIGVTERLHAVGLKPDGAMQTPDFGDAGWYDRGPRPGAPGPAVVVAHVHGPAGDDVFARLHELEPGDRVTVARTDGRSTFIVESVERAGKDELPYDRIWADTDSPVLRLITCGGKPDPITRMYPDNTIVYARITP